MMKPDVSNLNSLWASLMVEEWVRCGVDTFVLCPGSRCTPLTIALARHPGVRCIQHFDERGAAFCALGYGLSTGKPAGWVTTSGTAVANGLPAVVEAAQAYVPLLCITADRPPELRDTGANQTIDQRKIFGDYAVAFHELPCPDVGIKASYVLSTLDQAVAETARGPVHVNCMYREPLEPRVVEWEHAAYLDLLGSWMLSDAPFTRITQTTGFLDPLDLMDLSALLSGAKRGVILAGGIPPGHDEEALLRLAEATGFVVWPDVTSNLRLGCTHPQVDVYHEWALGSGCLDDVDVILHVGGCMLSKQVWAWVGGSRAADKIQWSAHSDRYDPELLFNRRIVGSPSVLCMQVAGEVKAQDVLKLDGAVRDALADYFVEYEGLSEPSIAWDLSRLLPDEHSLFLGNSMPIRDMHLFGDSQGAAVRVFANRGASGIDGLIASAVGVAEGRKAAVTLLLGDLSTLHDLNSLALVAKSAFPVLIVVVNNDGGGIFSFLPVSSCEDVFEPYFGTPHGLHFEAAAQLFGLPYVEVEDRVGFCEAYSHFLNEGESAVLEVRTDRLKNKGTHEAIQDLIRSKVSKLRPSTEA